jgi:hypothetical protein
MTIRLAPKMQDSRRNRLLLLTLSYRPIPELFPDECPRLSCTDHPGGAVLALSFASRLPLRPHSGKIRRSRAVPARTGACRCRFDRRNDGKGAARRRYNERTWLLRNAGCVPRVGTRRADEASRSLRQGGATPTRRARGLQCGENHVRSVYTGAADDKGLRQHKSPRSRACFDCVALTMRDMDYLETTVKRSVVLVLTLLLCGCANMNKTEQRMVSGAAIGGVVAGPIGAGVGAGVGYVVERFE